MHELTHGRGFVHNDIRNQALQKSYAIIFAQFMYNSCAIARKIERDLWKTCCDQISTIGATNLADQGIFNRPSIVDNKQEMAKANRSAYRRTPRLITLISQF